MSVKVIFGFEEMAKLKSFPKLMTTSDGLVVIFIREKCGTVIRSEDNHWVFGEYSERYGMSYFKDYNGEVTLKNE
ncbi:hypothetical protein PHG11b_23 [Flavobacterium phage 11b]|uniref:hypothetical protein n=1 Tax=Flavobacterium phage 11b TaxID=294631 RepID=UPI0000444135|nr:hypothetical protein PHG11b_23 [Flavobacterium phage 11b]CAH56650.1 hypothetical protein PHG11b_23 [Flavobacterium phage 11b]